MKMKQRGVVWCAVFLAILPNCGRIIDWGKSNFNQGTNFDVTYKHVAPFIKSVTMYDEMTTQAIFEVIWLADEVRTAYAQIYSFRLGKDEEKKNVFLRRQLEENSHYISFYVLSSHEVKLGDIDSKWSLFIDVDGASYLPLSIKKVELPHEYQLFFGSKWNRFKVPYLVRFSALDVDQHQIITPESKNLNLYVRSVSKQNIFTWNLDGRGAKVQPVVIPSEDELVDTQPKKIEPIVTEENSGEENNAEQKQDVPEIAPTPTDEGTI
jgi:hypothetical protein